MKVVLVSTPLTLGKRYTEFGGIEFPLAVGYLASYTRQHGFDVELWDYTPGGYAEDEYIDKLRNSSPKVIGLSCTTPTILNANKLAQIAKRVLPDVLVIIGGPHATAIPERTLKEFPAFDAICVGEGEETFLEVCNRVKEGRHLDGTRGVAHRVNGRVKVEERRPLIRDLDKLPFPARDLVDFKRYKIAHVSRGISRKFMNIMEIMTSRGCPNNCIFCAGHLNYGFSLRFRSVDNILAEVKECIEKYDTEHITINDDTFTLHPRLNDVCAGFKSLGVTWDCLTRVNVVTKDLLQMMVDAGCIRICFGVESGSPRMLKLIKKNISLVQVRNAFKWAHEVGVKLIDGAFMVGSHPSEDLEDVRMTVDLINEIKPHFWSFTILVPFPGTEVYRMMKEKGYISDEKWENFVMFGKVPSWRTDNFSGEELVRVQKWAMRETYLRLGYVLTMISRIRSLNELQYYVNVGLDFLKSVVIKRA